MWAVISSPGPSGDADVCRDVGLISSQYGRMCLASDAVSLFNKNGGTGLWMPYRF